MLFGNEKDQAVEKVAEGVEKKVLSTGEKIQVCRFTMKAGTKVPSHAHPNEQAGYIVSGKFKSTIGDETCMMEAGHFFRIPSNTPHSGYVFEDTILIDIYSPPR